MFDKVQNVYDALANKYCEKAMEEFRKGNRNKGIKEAFKGGMIIGGILSMPVVACCGVVIAVCKLCR